MSLTVALYFNDEYVFSYNITHNLSQMADYAKLYSCVWKPNENEIYLAQQLVKPLKAGLNLLKKKPESCKVFSPIKKRGYI